MTTSLTPSDVARETLKTLAARRLTPTPDNYAHVYQEISGAPAAADAQDKPALAWPRLIHDLLKQLETPHKGITITRKKDGVQTVLGRFSADNEVLFEKLQGLMHSWSDAPTAESLVEAAPAEMPAAAPAEAPAPAAPPAV